MGLRDIGATLPPGFRFYPSDEELVCHYLYKKIANGEVSRDTLVEIDLHTCEPWQLPDVAKLNSNEWYFFSFRDRKYATGFRTNRATTTGYWKATGKDRTVLDPTRRSIVGMRKTLVFYRNRAPNGIKTGWIMHEFRLENPHVPPKEDWVLCRVFHKAKVESVDNDVYDATAGGGGCGGGGDISPTFAASPPNIDHCTTGGYNQNSSFSQSPPHQSQNSSSTAALPNMMSAVLGRNYLQSSSQELCVTPSRNDQMVHSKSELDEYGFLFNMNFGEANLRDGGVPSGLEEMHFDDDSSLVFI
ncbi:protein CUP-SHAPED COTYLEDON 2-like [Coffea eugenioides]|uniref:protein CUP-SHAPED COTYLEDON 2-like n=1 Tax=Coffea eugenioides TaxID=49369 RepID=UPI000F60EAD8|nr:protein CUP-SHAPED COTYLEDON 2-like [Coffea eugenioides]